MAKQLITYSYPSSFVRPIPNLIGQQKASTQGNLTPGGNGSWDIGSKQILDTSVLLNTNSTVSGLSVVDGSVACVGRVAHVAAFANQPCEIRLLFGGSEANDVDLLFAGLLQVQDYPPMAVPSDTTKWTVWRNITIHDRYFVPILVNDTTRALGESGGAGQPRPARRPPSRLGSAIAMWLIRAALRRPITVLVAIIAVALTAGFAVNRMRADIFPDLDLPVIYVAQPYGGMSPAQMEGYITYYYEYHFLYVNGIESVESKSIQNTSLLKLTFHAGTDMAEALAQTIGYTNRARAFMPPGTVGPFIMRFDAGSVPVAQLVFSSTTRSVPEMQDIALNRVRPIFATLPGVSAPPPFGGSQRTIVVRVDPEKLRQYRLSPDEVVSALNRATIVLPSGNVRTGDLIRIASTNATLGGNIQELLDALPAGLLTAGPCRFEVRLERPGADSVIRTREFWVVSMSGT
jgi:hypothetical protein